MGTKITAGTIKSKARDFTRLSGIEDDKFKICPTWVNNFKRRHGIRWGVWEGTELNDSDLDDDNPDGPDLVDELQVYAEETEKYCYMHAIDEAKERERLQDAQQAADVTNGALQNRRLFEDVSQICTIRCSLSCIPAVYRQRSQTDFCPAGESSHGSGDDVHQGATKGFLHGS